MRQQFSIPENDPDFSDDTDLFNYGYIDSIGAVELTAFVEKNFGIRFTDSDWANSRLNTIGEISAFIAKHSEGQSNHA